MEHRLAFGEALSAGCGATPFARVARFPSVRDLPAAVESLERPIVLPPVLSNKDGGVRWKEGERLHHLMEQACLRFGANDAVVTDQAVITYRDLDKRANQVARYLIEQGLKSGDRVGLLFDKTIETYVAMLAVLKVNAAYVPLDPGFPVERIGFILADASMKAVVSMSGFEETAERVRRRGRSSRHRSARHRRNAGDAPRGARGGAAVDQVCYIIYTSGTTGKPKGVVIEHPSICNFVRVAAELYGFAPGDRVYQGMTIAFDFSVRGDLGAVGGRRDAGAGPPGVTLVGDELADFLRDRRVTCICCCPTLLATIETRSAADCEFCWSAARPARTIWWSAGIAPGAPS